MKTEKMTVHKALCEIKIADSKVSKDLQSQYINVNKHINTKINGLEIDGYKRLLIGAYDKMQDDLNRTLAIKMALNRSNAETSVVIGGTEYRIAEAIWMKNYGIPTMERVLNTLVAQYTSATQALEQQNGEKLDAATERYISTTYQNKDKIDPAEIASATKWYRENNTYDLIDPLNLKSKIEELKSKIDAFTAEFDSAIQTSNAVTEITVEY